MKSINRVLLDIQVAVATLKRSAQNPATWDHLYGDLRLDTIGSISLGGELSLCITRGQQLHEQGRVWVGICKVIPAEFKDWTFRFEEDSVGHHVVKAISPGQLI